MSNIKQYQDENFSLQVQTFPDCQVKFTVTLSPKNVLDERKSAIKKIGKEVSLPGFRKGKAPESFVLKNFSEHIDKEWRNDLAMKAFNKAIKMAQVYPFTEKSIKSTKIESFSETEGAVIVYEFESTPNIPLINPSDLKIEKVDIEPVSEAKIEQIIEDIRYQFATWEEVKDRPAKAGDFVDVDIENLDNPGEFICKDSRLELTPGKTGLWLINILEGMNPGESKEGTSALDPDVDNPQFLPTHCKVTLNSIHMTTLPEFDDELAKKAKVESVEKLKEKIVKDLEALAETTAQQKRRAFLAEAILDTYKFDIPESIILGSLPEAMPRFNKNDLSEGETLEERTQKNKETAITAIKKDCCWQALIQRYIEKQKIHVSEQELMIEMIKTSYMQKNLDFEKNYERIAQNLQSEILLKKVLDDILEKM